MHTKRVVGMSLGWSDALASSGVRGMGHPRVDSMGTELTGAHRGEGWVDASMG
jgi:hypothetical protein